MKKIVGMFLMFASMSLFAAQYKVIVPLPAGSTPDIQTRKIFEQVEKQTGDNFIIINKPGAETLIGYKQFLEESEKNKNVLFISHSLYYITFTNDEENSIDKKTKPVSTIQKFSYALVTRKDSKIESVSDIKGKLNVGGSPKFCLKAIETIKKDKDLRFPYYASDKDAFLNLFSNDLDAVCTGSNSVAYASFKDRTKVVKGFDKEIDFGNTSGILAPKSMPDEEVKRLNAAINTVYKEETLRNWFIEISGLPPEVGSTDSYIRHVKELKKFVDTHSILLK